MSVALALDSPHAPRGARLPLGDLVTEGGATLRDAVLQYRVLGDTAAAARNGWILVFHALTGSADVDAWWEPLVGPGRPLDTARHAVVCANLLGSCYGSTGPARVRDGSFPALTTADLARAHEPLLAHLGVERLALVTGGSLGGMVALEFARRSVRPIGALVVLASPAVTTAQAIAYNAVQRLAIEADPAWRDGRYIPGRGPTRGLAAARAIAMITYRSHVEFGERFARRRTRHARRFDVEHYLRRHGEKLVARFDARSYVALMGAMDAHDVGDLAQAGRDTAARVRHVVGVGIDTDILYRPAEVEAWVAAYRAAGAVAEYQEVSTPYGHDAFLIEFERVGRIIREAVACAGTA
jgi:homoserine O-acetyltransferase